MGFSRGDDSGKEFLLNIMVREINAGDPDSVRYAFNLNGNNAIIDGDQFVHVTGTPWWSAQFVINSIGTGSSNILSNSKNIFHLGTLNGGGDNGGNYGYFSNYAAVEARSYVQGVGQPGTKLCWGETAQLVADGGLTYQWIPGTYLSDSLVQKPYTTPLTDIKYKVEVRGASCAPPDTAQVEVLVSDSVSAAFDVDKKFGCAPLTVNFTNKSYQNQKNFWYLDDVSFSLKAKPDPITLENNTDSAIVYVVKLYTQNRFCFKSHEVPIIVYPEITAGFDQDTVIGCHPLPVSFTDTSSGNVHADGYEWTFGDGDLSDTTDPTHIFRNIGANTIIYPVRLVTTSPFLCTDTARANITVHPVVQASLAIDSTVSCSPMDINFD
ncbi:MAG: hypothetical protein HC896_15015, partial [Bacteroidales bacterium]|nr:hypothetical protein [Bacteroidales bacterium]